MIRRFGVKNFKSLRDVELELTPIHVLIGPNGSGKTSILQAIQSLARTADHPLTEAFVGRWTGTDLVWRGGLADAVTLLAEFDHDGEVYRYVLSVDFRPSARQAVVHNEQIAKPPESPVMGSELNGEMNVGRPGKGSSFIFRVAHQGENGGEADSRSIAAVVSNALRNPHLYRLSAPLLALPVATDPRRAFRLETDGFGLAQLLDDILGYDRKDFTALEDELCNAFPFIESIKLVSEPAYTANVDDPRGVRQLSERDGKGIRFKVKGANDTIAAAHMADGVMLVLAYLTLLFIPEEKAPRLILVEEPENGVHHELLEKVIAILRRVIDMRKRTQIIMTTHSPYLLDLFGPNEVTLCRQEADGSTSVHRLSESEAVRKQAGIFSLGEIWTGEGDDTIAVGSKANGGGRP